MIARAFSQLFEVKYDADVLEPLVMFSGVGLLASLLLVLDGIDLGAILY
jgi:hypothetical protein